MNAPHNPTPMTALALKLVNGEPVALADEVSFYEWNDWVDEAHYALDTGEYAGLDAMLATQDAFDRYIRWQGQAWNERDAERREFTSFDQFRDNMAPLAVTVKVMR